MDTWNHTAGADCACGPVRETTVRTTSGSGAVGHERTTRWVHNHVDDIIDGPTPLTPAEVRELYDDLGNYERTESDRND